MIRLFRIDISELIPLKASKCKELIGRFLAPMRDSPEGEFVPETLRNLGINGSGLSQIMRKWRPTGLIQSNFLGLVAFVDLLTKDYQFSQTTLASAFRSSNVGPASNSDLVSFNTPQPKAYGRAAPPTGMRMCWPFFVDDRNPEPSDSELSVYELIRLFGIILETTFFDFRKLMLNSVILKLDCNVHCCPAFYALDTLSRIAALRAIGLVHEGSGSIMAHVRNRIQRYRRTLLCDQSGLTGVGYHNECLQTSALTLALPSRLVEFKRISLTGFRSCTSRSRYRSVSKQTTR
ncbi:hypothetical protein Tco_0604110, partial [Tanacetum coccineum]